jgi:hypothetical protein
MKLNAYFVSRRERVCVCEFPAYFVSKLGSCDYDLGATHALLISTLHRAHFKGYAGVVDFFPPLRAGEVAAGVFAAGVFETGEF